MNYKYFFHHWDKVHDVTLRLIKQIPQEKLSYKPEHAQFNLRELVTHVYYVEKIFADSAREGHLDKVSTSESPQLRTVQDLLNYAREVHENTNRIFLNKTEEDFDKMVQTPWGEEPLFYHIHSAYEYHWHLRGQIYLYMGMLGILNLVDLYDYKHISVRQ